jgi:hypothetical protein
MSSPFSPSWFSPMHSWMPRLFACVYKLPEIMPIHSFWDWLAFPSLEVESCRIDQHIQYKSNYIIVKILLCEDCNAIQIIFTNKVAPQLIPKKNFFLRISIFYLDIYYSLLVSIQIGSASRPNEIIACATNILHSDLFSLHIWLWISILWWKLKKLLHDSKVYLREHVSTLNTLKGCYVYLSVSQFLHMWLQKMHMH